MILTNNFLYYFKKKLKFIPIHPQWLIYKNYTKKAGYIGSTLRGKVLDIGCADQYVKKYMQNPSDYTGLDYYSTSTEWYKTTPDIYGDAQALPFGPANFDQVILFDVLEHIPDPVKCLNEIYRVLKKNGCLVLQVPFLYPLHDAPLDFNRWTLYGLQRIVSESGFNIKEMSASGNPIESAGLLFNIGLTKSVINWIDNRHPLSVLLLLLPFIILITNIFCWLLSFFDTDDSFMATGYCLLLEKK